MNRADLLPIVSEALTALGGKARITEICKYIWDKYEKELKNSGTLLYTWQYDMRWAGQYLRNNGTLAPADTIDRSWKFAKPKS